METDISKVLAYEIKKELADRYFGFRKFIEQEKFDLASQARHHLHIEQKIAYDLVRIYIMLKEPALIHIFFELTGLDEDTFYDPYTISSPTVRQRVFEGITVKGLTRAGRFKKLLLNCYDNLTRHVEEYREKIAEMLLDHETIMEEIKIFYRNNDLTHIMGLLRSLDATPHMSSSLENAAIGQVSHDSFEQKMRVRPPAPVEELLSTMPPITPFSHIKKDLKKLAEQAFLLHGNEFNF